MQTLNHPLVAALALALSLTLLSTGCAEEKKAAPPPAVAPAPAPVQYPHPCPKLRQCLDAYKAAVPSAAQEFESVWTYVKSEMQTGRAAQRCTATLRNYATRPNAPPSCK